MIKKGSGGILNHFKIIKTMYPLPLIIKRLNRNKKKTQYLVNIKTKTQNQVNQ